MEWQQFTPLASLKALPSSILRQIIRSLSAHRCSSFFHAQCDLFIFGVSPLKKPLIYSQCTKKSLSHLSHLIPDSKFSISIHFLTKCEQDIFLRREGLPSFSLFLLFCVQLSSFIWCVSRLLTYIEWKRDIQKQQKMIYIQTACVCV